MPCAFGWDVQAALLRVRLKVLAQFTERRRTIAATYLAGLRNPKVELMAPPGPPCRMTQGLPPGAPHCS